jgi:hypothetical protein
VSKESEIKKRLDKIEKEKAAASQPEPQTTHRVKYQTVLPARRRRRRFSTRFIVLLVIWLIALVVALLFVSGKFQI